MPSVTYNGQCFSIDGRRIWVLGASLQYARIPAAHWQARIEAARQAGFNTIETACPWMLHEPRRGRFVFDGQSHLRGFVQACAAARMRVILRVGPYIGCGFDGGGIPGWLMETPGIGLREGNELFLEHVSRYFRKMLAEVTDLQAGGASGGGRGGPILLVQSEHAWTCSNDRQAEKYLHEITRFIRESGITVPITNANDLWQESPGTIDTWRGYDELLVHLRQLRSVQPDAPRLVSAFDAARTRTWGDERHSTPAEPEKSASDVLRRMAEILACGAQPIVSPFHAGTNVDFIGGRLAGGPDRFITTTAAFDAPLSECGQRSASYHALRRLATFANHFGHVFAELDPEYQPVAIDPTSVHAAESSDRPLSRKGSGAPVKVISTVHARGSLGGIAFVFGGADTTTTTLVLENGVRLPIDLADSQVGWYLLDADLQGTGRLDYANLCPWGMVDRAILVLFGPAKAQVYMSIDGTPLDTIVPALDARPLVVDHMGTTVVICNGRQIDAVYHDDSAVYVGIAGFDSRDRPLPHPEYPKAWVIRRNARVEQLSFADTAKDKTVRATRSARGTAMPSASRSPALEQWQAASSVEYVTGESPRFASLEGPETLSACGAPYGYGWYRISFAGSTGKAKCHAAEAADRLHLYLDGRLIRVAGVGPGAIPGPFELKAGKARQTLVALVDNLGRFSEGNDLCDRKGIWGHIHAVKPLRVGKARIIAAKPANPFELRGFISGLDAAQLSDTQQAVWKFSHTRKTPILVDVDGARCTGTFVLNDKPVAYYAGITGACSARIMLDPRTVKSFKRGSNTLRFAPDVRQDGACEELIAATTIYDCVEAITESATWSFAKWEPPTAAAFTMVERTSFKSLRGKPCWWRAAFAGPVSMPANHDGLWLDVSGLSKGQAFINGHNLGRYFTATAEGKPVGPQTRLCIPGSWIDTRQANHIMLFDEHGFEPANVRLRASDHHSS